MSDVAIVEDELMDSGFSPDQMVAIIRMWIAGSDLDSAIEYIINQEEHTDVR